MENAENKNLTNYGTITDMRGNDIMVQQSSSAQEDSIWIRVDYSNLKDMIPSLLLNVEQSKELITALQKFVNDEKEKNYQDYLNLLREKSKNSIRITEKNKDLICIGQYVDEYPEKHIVEIYEDFNETIYRLDKN